MNEGKYKKKQHYKNMADQELLNENTELKKQIELLNLQVNELNETNDHLITATWRERELKKELQETKDVIEEQNKNIADSINYSLKIQRSIIATEEDLKKDFTDSFIYYRPKDVVSGDYPWHYKKDNFVYLAAVDCTGHGVPGAMLSVISCLLLNDIINDDGYLTPAEVLNKLHDAVVDTLKQRDTENAANDGLDIGLCRVDLKSNEVVFSGAHRPMYYFHEGEMKRLKGDRCPIGGCQYDKFRKPFKDQKVTLNKGNSVFVFSDGLPDQFGGDDEDKYGTGFINKIAQEKLKSGESMSEIRTAIDQDIISWQGDHDQLDDILLIGLTL